MVAGGPISRGKELNKKVVKGSREKKNIIINNDGKSKGKGKGAHALGLLRNDDMKFYDITILSVHRNKLQRQETYVHLNIIIHTFASDLNAVLI